MKQTQQAEHFADGWRHPNGTRVYQEEHLLPSGLPQGHTDYGFWAFSPAELWVASATEGLWVMDRLGSYHRYPYRTMEAAERHLRLLRGSMRSREDARLR